MAIQDVGMGIAAGIISGAAGQGQQRKQQKYFTEMQMEAQKEMTDYNQKKAMEMWRDTNYSAQVEQAKLAGLNPAMLYGMGGGGGTTAQVTAGSVGSGQAQDQGGRMMEGMAIALQAKQQEANIELIKAQTDKTKVEAEKIGGVDTAESTARTGEITARTIAQKLETQYMTEGTGNEGQVSGYQMRYQQARMDIYTQSVENDLTQIKIQQMPKELALKTQEVVLMGQKIAIDAINAKTAQERNEIYARIEQLKLDLNNTQFQENLEQRQTEFLTNSVFRGVENAMSAAIPWYEPGHTTTTTTDSYEHSDGTRRTETQQTRKRN